MSSQGFLFRTVPVYLRDSPQITQTAFVAHSWATLHLRQAFLTGVHKVKSQSILMPCYRQIQEEGTIIAILVTPRGL